MAGSCGDLLPCSRRVCWPRSRVRSASEGLPTSAGGRFRGGLSSWSGAHVFRGHVPSVQGSKDHAIVISDATRKRALLASILLANQAHTFCALVLLQSAPEHRESWSGWDGVGTAAVTLVGSIACFTRILLTIPKSPSAHLQDRLRIGYLCAAAGGPLPSKANFDSPI